MRARPRSLLVRRGRQIGGRPDLCQRRQPDVVPEAELNDDDDGLVPAQCHVAGGGATARWFHRPGRGDGLPLTGFDQFEAATYFPMLGMTSRCCRRGEPMTTYR